MSQEGLDVMLGLILEDGRTWGEAAVDHQYSDAVAFFDPEPPNLHYWTRPRGGSKTSDIAGFALAWLAVEAPPLANGRVVASSSDQAAFVIDAAAGFIARTPELDGVIIPQAEKLVGPNGAYVEVLSQSDSGSWGLRDCHLLVADEFAQWPETRGAHRVWTAVRSTVTKVDGCRLMVMTSAGEPSHWSYGIFKDAQNDPLGQWRVSEMPGPTPWHKPIQLEALRRELRPSEYERLVLNIWSEDEDRAISEDDYNRAAQDYVTQAVRPGVRYLMTVDIGVKVDASVMCISHKEPIDREDPHGPQRVVVDHLERWIGSKRKPVQISDVAEWIRANAPKWNRCEVHADPTQFVGYIQQLNRAGVRAQEWPFTATSVGVVATALVQTFRSGQIMIPDIPELKEELLRVRLRESAPGVTRLDHEKGGHDDQAVVIGMACHLHLGNSWGHADAFAAAWRELARKDADARPRGPSTPRKFFAPDDTPPGRILPGGGCRNPRYWEGVCVHCHAPQEVHAHRKVPA